jgi:hypothetical protein
MSIKIPPPPKESMQALISSLEKLPSAAMGGATAMILENPKSLESSISFPHKVYNLGLQDIVGGKGIEAAHLVSWRYLINQGTRGTAAAEVNYDERKKSNQFSQLNQGAFASATLEEIHKVVDDRKFQQGSYELRLLRVPALYVTALWLNDLREHHDAVIPIAPTIEVLKPSEVYTPSQFIKVLREPAQEKLRFDSSPRLEQAR